MSLQYVKDTFPEYSVHHVINEASNTNYKKKIVQVYLGS